MAAVDSWSDGWETIADQEANKAKSETGDTAGGTGSSSGSSTTSNSSSFTAKSTGPQILLRKVPIEEENRKLWEAANSSNPFEILPTTSPAPNKVVTYKPELKILKRAPPSATQPTTVTPASDSPALLDRKEKERRYAEARERLFGPASSTPASDSNTPSSNTPTTGMSRSSSSTGLTNKTGETGSGSTTPSKERGGGGLRGGRKGGRGSCSGGNTPRSRSPGGKLAPGDKKERGSDPNRTSGIIGGITKVTETGWVYTGTGQPPKNLSPSPQKLNGGDRVEPRVNSPGIISLSSGMMSINLNQQAGYNPTGNPYGNAPGMVNQWGMGPLGNGPGNCGTTQLGQRQPGPGYAPPHPGFLPQKTVPQNQTYPPPLPQYPQYTGPPYFKSQPFPQQPQQLQPQQNQNFQSYQSSTVSTGYNMSPHQLPLLQHPTTPPYLNYNRPASQNSSGPSPLSSSVSLVSRYEPSGAPRTLYLQDPNASAPRPPPPQGNLVPGLGNHSFSRDTNGDSIEQVPIRLPRGPDGRGFAARGGRGRGFGTS